MRIPLFLRVGACLVSTVYLVLGILLPVFQIFGEKGFALNTLFSSATLQLVRITFWQATLSTVIASALGFIIAMIWGRTKRGAWIFRIPFALPSVVVANAALFFLGSKGLQISYSLKAVIFTHVWINAPWIALVLIEAHSQIPKIQIEAARSLGAGRFALFHLLVWPYLKWALSSAAVQVFSLCAASFGIVLLLGGGPPVDTLETAIYASLRFGSLDLQAASALAIWQFLFGLLPVIFLSYFSARNERQLEVSFARDEGENRVKVMIPVLFAAPFFISIAYFKFDLGLYQEMFHPLLTTLGVSVSTAFLALIFTGALFLVPFRGVQVLAQMPAATSALVLGLGFWLSYSKWIDPFEGSFAAIIFIQAVSAVPLCYRMLWPAIRNQQKLQLQAALSLGANPIKAFAIVEVPRLKSTLLNIFSITAGLSVGEVGVASLFQSDRVKPLSVWMSEQMIRYRFEEAQMGAFVLMILSLLLTMRKKMGEISE